MPPARKSPSLHPVAMAARSGVVVRLPAPAENRAPRPSIADQTRNGPTPHLR